MHVNLFVSVNVNLFVSVNVNLFVSVNVNLFVFPHTHSITLALPFTLPFLLIHFSLPFHSITSIPPFLPLITSPLITYTPPPHNFTLPSIHSLPLNSHFTHPQFHTQMFKLFILPLLATIAFFYSFIHPELSSLPHLSKFSSIILNTPLSDSSFLILSSFILFLFPLLIITLIISYFKKYIFQHIKSINTSFKLACYLLLSNYLIGSSLSFLETILKLSFSKIYYVLFRLSPINNKHFVSYYFLFRLLCSPVLQVFLFLSVLLICELTIAYQLSKSRKGFSSFLQKNFIGISFICLFIFFYLFLYIYLTYSYYSFCCFDLDLIQQLMDTTVLNTIWVIALGFVYYILSMNSG